MRLLPRSLSGRVLFWQIACSATLVLALCYFFYGELRQIVIASVDQTLHAKAQIFTGLLHEEHGRIELELSDITGGEYGIPRSGHYYRVVMGKTVLAASPSLAVDDFVFAADGAPFSPGVRGERFFTSRGPAGEPVRVLRFNYRALGTSFELTLAESLAGGLAMITAFRRFLTMAVPLGILLSCAASWVIVRTSMAPLSRFSDAIGRITHTNLDERIDPRTTVEELAGIALSFNAMLDRLHHVFDSQKRLAADASHELKTPLAVIKTQCDVTLQQERSPAAYREALLTIRSETASMIRLVKDLLSLARLDARRDGGSLPREETTTVGVGELVQHAVRLTEQSAARHEVLVSAQVADSLQVRGDRPALEEALVNLVENAIRYNRRGGAVTIHASPEGKERIAIEVSDTGIGIGEGDMERIFERFYRSAAVRGSEGTGLGLSIVKAIAEAHRGEIGVVSKLGQGTSFTLVLPAG